MLMTELINKWVNESNIQRKTLYTPWSKSQQWCSFKESRTIGLAEAFYVHSDFTWRRFWLKLFLRPDFLERTSLGHSMAWQTVEGVLACYSRVMGRTQSCKKSLVTQLFIYSNKVAETETSLGDSGCTSAVLLPHYPARPPPTSHVSLCQKDAVSEKEKVGQPYEVLD